MVKVELKETLFPHETIRTVQDQMVANVYGLLQKGTHSIIHAPTGIGKTVSALAPALSTALKKDLRVFFLTSRHTQHTIAIDTLKKIKEKHEISFTVVDLIGKKHMCLQDVEALSSGDFLDFCKKLRDKGHCEFYSNTKKSSQRPTVQAENTLSELKVLSPVDVSGVISLCEKPKLCPYEVSSFLAKDASVIVADYNIIFNPIIRDSLFGRADIKLEKCIIVVDEGHNLPSRCRELLTAKLSSVILDRAIKEAEKYKYFELVSQLKHVKAVLDGFGSDLNFNKEEQLIKKAAFEDCIETYDELVALCNSASDDIRDKQKQSYVGSVGEFLAAWQGPDLGFARIASKDFSSGSVVLQYRCLDPSLITREVIDRSYATILMSGTLLPTYMYEDILGFSNSEQMEFENPFPHENRLCLVVPETTTKFTRRGEAEFTKIAEICNKIVQRIPGNVALFFPSYGLRDQVYKYFYPLCERKKILEKQGVGKKEREELISEFKQSKDSGAVLLAVSSGSFGEGIDLPGDLLKGVVVVGLPLEKPDLETKELIDYYDDKYGKGFDYGYIFPAFTKCLQNAGRCIRSETDKGVIVFLDERFSWSNYMRCFPDDINIKISKMYEDRISRFFSGGGVDEGARDEDFSEGKSSKNVEELGGFVSGDRL